MTEKLKKRKVGRLRWIILLLGLLGLGLSIVAQENNIITFLLGAVALTLATTYFVIFEWETLREFSYGTKMKAAPIRIISSFALKLHTRVAQLGAQNRHKNDGAIYMFALALIVMISVVILFFNLGKKDLHGDEHQVVSAATSYYYSGDFYRWDWVKDEPVCLEDTLECRYDRAWPHSWLIAQSYKVFGISEWSSRVPSVLFGIFLIIFSYFFTKFFIGNPAIALIATYSIAISPSFIRIGQYTRMYALLIPLALVIIYLLYRGITESSKLSTAKNAVGRFIYKNLNFSYSHLFAAFVILAVTITIHINVLVILPAVFLFVIYMAFTTKEARYIIVSLIGIISVELVFTAMLTTSLLDKIANFISPFDRQNVVYSSYLTDSILPWKIGIFALLFGATGTFFIKDRDTKNKFVYLYTIVAFSLIFFVYIADRYASFVYISHIVPIAFILIVGVYFFFVSLFRTRWLQILLAAIFLANLLFLLSKNSNDLFYNNPRLGDYSIAYREIISSYDPDNEVIFGQYLRKYYLDDLPPNTNIIDMLKNRQYETAQFIEDLAKHKAGWITWESQKSYHLNKKIQSYISAHFKKIHGKDFDNTGVEVYYFTEEMIPGTTNPTSSQSVVSPKLIP